MKEKHAVKLTLTFDDGTTEDYDVFISVVAMGLVPCGKDGDTVTYTAPVEGFSCMAHSHIATTPEVAAGMLQAVMEIITKMMEAMPPEVVPGFLDALLSLSTKRTIHHHESRAIKPSEG